MPSPFLRDGIYYYRVAVPTDVAEVAKGRSYRIAVAGQSASPRLGQNLQVSLRTSDRAVAKARFNELAAQAETIYAMLRHGPQELSHRAVLAHAGEVRRIWVERYDENPGTASLWDKVAGHDALADQGVRHPLQVPTDRSREAEVELRWGPIVDAYLDHRRLWLVPASRRKLMESVRIALGEVAQVNRRKADADYSEDVGQLKYPTLGGGGRRAATAGGAIGRPSGKPTTFSEVLDHELEQREVAMPEATVRKYRRAAAEFVAYRGGDADIATVTLVQGNGWRRAMIGEGRLKLKTIKDRLSLVRTMLEWSMAMHGEDEGREQEALHSRGNPFAKVRKVEVPKTPGDQLTYTLAEARQILAAAKLETTRDELRWLPWVCAYTGARVNEIAPLTPDDVFSVGDRWFLRITTLGGKKIKNSHSERRVPVHRDLIAEGFVDWAKAQSPKNERLFKKGADQSVRHWVRNRLKIERPLLKPSHSWRHLFEDRCVGCEISDDAKRYVTGRSGGGSGTRYGKSQELLPGLALEMEKFPGYF